LELELPLSVPVPVLLDFSDVVPLVLAVPLSLLLPEVPLLPCPAVPDDEPWLADDPEPWSCPMPLLPEPELPLLPWEAELPDWPVPLAADPEPLPLPLCAMAKAAETTRIAKICNKRFISLFLPLLRTGCAPRPHSELQISNILWRQAREKI
jgi:hypothetical protein